LLVAVGTSSVLALAVPAQADQGPSQMDQTFLQALKDNGLQLKSDDAALKLAHSTCDVLGRTGSAQQALEQVKQATKWTSIKKITNFGAYAAQGYCPSSMPKS
jgi:hypothetical protein